MGRVFFTNSGTEAIEGALKAARKYAWKKGTGRYRVYRHGEFLPRQEHGRAVSDRA